MLRSISSLWDVEYLLEAGIQALRFSLKSCYANMCLKLEHKIKLNHSVEKKYERKERQKRNLTSLFNFLCDWCNNQSNRDNDKHLLGALSVITEMVNVYSQMIYTEMTQL